MEGEEDKKVCGYEIQRQGEDTIMRVNCDGCINSPSLEDNPECMARTIEKLFHMRNVTKLLFFQKRDYEYDFDQTTMLTEISGFYSSVIRQGILRYSSISSGYAQDLDKKYADMQHIVLYLLKSDPLGAYVELRRMYRHERILKKNITDPEYAKATERLLSILNYLVNSLSKTKLISVASPYLSGYKLGERDVYRKIFAASIKPDFMYTKLLASYPTDGDEIDNYSIGSTEVTIFSLSDDVRYLYHVMPPEFKLNEDRYELLDTARRILSEHKPKRSEFTDPQRMRQVFSNVSGDLLGELAEQRGITLREKEFKELTEILVRYTVGFGLVEVLLSDEGIQDISINSPMGRIPIFVVHGKHGDCMTNIVPTSAEADSWASKLRMISGRPLDEANPILDTSLELPNASVRSSTITEPLDPSGIAFSFRRHRSKPWTLPLFIHNNMISPVASGILSFIIDGTRSFLVCGTRGSGKSSFLSSLIIEIMRRYRIITIEDTLELPTRAMRDLGFNIQPMKVASALTGGSNEMNAEDGIRSTLRLGDSALIVGEVRSTEAKALYEAMRVGAASNVVGGTIHGDSPYGIFDRLVNDIGVPKTSFKATDICVIANPIKSADGLHQYRRVLQITEVRKHWKDDPYTEGGFVDLLRYNSSKDVLEPTDDLINGDSEILKAIAGNVNDYAGKWDMVWDNIMLRADAKEEQVKVARETGNDALLEAEFTIRCNDKLHMLTEQVKNDTGTIDSKKIFSEWKTWLHQTVKKMEMSHENL